MLSLSIEPWTAITSGAFAVFAPALATKSHAHNALQLVLSPGHTVEIVARARAHRGRCLVVAPGEPHTLATAHPVLVLLVDALDRRAAALRACVQRERVAELELDPRQLHACVTLRDPDAIVAALLDATESTPAAVVLSRASRAAVEYVRSTPSNALRRSVAAARAGVSASRLSHLFTKEVGLPFRRFVLWCRLQRAVAALSRGESVACAAAEAGFSDAPHLTRVFRSHFGVTPTTLRRLAPGEGPQHQRSSRSPPSTAQR